MPKRPRARPLLFATRLAQRLCSGPWPPLVCLAIATLFTLDQAAAGSWFKSHEHLRYPVLSEHFYQAFLHGMWWPRWLPDLNGGFGYPQFVYYQPLFFFLTLPFRALLGEATAACWATVACVLFVGSWGAFRLSHSPGAPWTGALGVAGFFLMPYVAVDLLVRGDLSELLATALVPWALLYYLRVLRLRADPQQWGWGSQVLGLSLSSASVMLAHPIIGILLGVLFALPLPLLLMRAATRKTLPALLLAGLAALLLSSPYTLPLGLMKDQVQLHGAFSSYPAAEHVVHWSQFLESHWDFGGSHRLGEPDKMPLRLGGLWTALAVIGAVAGRKRHELRIVAAIFVVAVVAMTPLCSSLWSLAPFSMMQFPWRLLSLCVALQLALLRGWFDFSQTTDNTRLLWGLAILVAICGWTPEQFRTAGRLKDGATQVRARVLDAPRSWDTLESGELSPQPVNKRPRRTRAALPLIHSEAKVHINSTNPYRPSATIQAASTTLVTIQQYYFPGFEVRVDGEVLGESKLSQNAHGLLQFQLPANPSTRPRQVEVYYAQPWGARLGFGLALAGMLGLGMLAFATRSRSTSILAFPVQCPAKQDALDCGQPSFQ